MMDKIIGGILLIVGIINLLPLAALFDITKTIQLYGVPVEGENLTILMRHRAVLLSLVGIALISSAFKPEYRILAIALALVSKFAFLFLTFTAMNYSGEIRQVALIDIVAIALLLAALGFHLYTK